MRIWTLCLLLALAGTAQAEPREFCVRTPAEFDRAWRAADDDDVVIKLATGTYDMRGSCIDRTSYCVVSDHDVRLRGGYNATCSARTDDPSKTVLTAPGRTLEFGSLDCELDGDLHIDRVSFRDLAELSIVLEAPFQKDDTLLLDRIVLDGAKLWIYGPEQTYIGNSVFTRLTDTALFTDEITLTHSTVADGVGLFFGSETARVLNSVFWNNTTDFSAIGTSLKLVNNLMSSREFQDVDLQLELGTISGDPRFLDAANGDYRLAHDSPAINRAISVLSVGSDHDGGPRVYGDAGDLGAFETEVGSLASTLVVTNRNDSGPGSLRQALIDANALPDENRIEFAIGSSCGPQVIRPQTLLPEIREPVRILGFTQPGAMRNADPFRDDARRCIVLDGGGTLGMGLRVNTGTDVSVAVDGLAFGGFNLVALNLQGGNGHVVVGSQFGPAGRLSTLRPNLVGVQAGNFGAGEGLAVSIGGADREQRNVMSGNDGDGIVVGRGSDGVQVINNLVGTGIDDENRPNARGIVVLGPDADVVGNVVSYNRQDGVLVRGADARRVRIERNRIGESALCSFICEHAGNLGSGVRIESGANDGKVRENVIANNGRDGIVVTGARRHHLSDNRITNNQQQPIDLGNDGTNALANNVSGVLPASSGNEAINRPTLDSATGNGTQATLTGSYASKPGRYRLEFYTGSACDPVPPVPQIPTPAPQGRPEVLVGAGELVLPASTIAGQNSTNSFSWLIAGSFTPGQKVMAIATRIVDQPNGTRRLESSSEVSNCVTYSAP